MNDIEIQLLAYIDGALSEPERRELEARLSDDPALRDMLTDMRALSASLAALPQAMPSARADARFHAFLAAEQSAARPKPAMTLRRFADGWGLAAATVLLLIGAGFGWFWRAYQKQQTEIQALRQEMKTSRRLLTLSMLDRPSASERIQAVNALQSEQADPKIIEALIHTLYFDDMPNVRMKAAQALAHFGEDPQVKEALINSLSAQESPEVQITLIETLVAMGEKRAVPSFKQMLEDKTLMEAVKKRAAVGIRVLM